LSKASSGIGLTGASRIDPAIRAEHKERFTRLEAAVAKSAIGLLLIFY
jgi:hypothetical protein